MSFLSKTTFAVLFKFLMTFVVASISFIFLAGNTFGSIAVLSVFVTVINYLAGDLFVLPKFGNAATSIGNGIMGALVAYIFALAIVQFNTTLNTLVIFAILIAVGEYFFHYYLLKSDKVAP